MTVGRDTAPRYVLDGPRFGSEEGQRPTEVLIPRHSEVGHSPVEVRTNAAVCLHDATGATLHSCLEKTVYRLATDRTVRGLNPGEGPDFPHSSRPPLGSTQTPIQWVSGLFPGLKRPGRGVDHPPPSSTDINTFAASYLNTQGLNNSCLKSPASTLVDLTFQSRALRSFSLNQLRNLSL